MQTSDRSNRANINKRLTAKMKNLMLNLKLSKISWKIIDKLLIRMISLMKRTPMLQSDTVSSRAKTRVQSVSHEGTDRANITTYFCKKNLIIIPNQNGESFLRHSKFDGSCFVVVILM